MLMCLLEGALMLLLYFVHGQDTSAFSESQPHLRIIDKIIRGLFCPESLQRQELWSAYHYRIWNPELCYRWVAIALQLWKVVSSWEVCSWTASAGRSPMTPSWWRSSFGPENDYSRSQLVFSTKSFPGNITKRITLAITTSCWPTIFSVTGK